MNQHPTSDPALYHGDPPDGVSGAPSAAPGRLASVPEGKGLGGTVTIDVGPYSVGGGWYEIGGTRIRGKKQAEAAVRKLRL